MIDEVILDRLKQFGLVSTLHRVTYMRYEREGASTERREKNRQTGRQTEKVTHPPPPTRVKVGVGVRDHP